MSEFEGFSPANTTPVPDVLFDELLTQLNGSELKVLLYIIRRTLGFKKGSDAISLTQFQKGITTLADKVLDKGCGIGDRATIVKALESLEKKGYIEAIKGKTSKGDNAITLYQIRFKASSRVVGKPNQGSGQTQPPKDKRVVGKTNQGSMENPTRVVGKPNPQETVIQYTDLQETVIESVNTSNVPQKQDDDTHTPKEKIAQQALPGTNEKIKPVMPEDNAPWPSPEVAVQIVEARIGKRYRETARSKDLNFARRMFKEDSALTREQFTSAYDKRNDDWWHEHQGLLHLHHMVEKDRVHEMIDKILVEEQKKSRQQKKSDTAPQFYAAAAVKARAQKDIQDPLIAQTTLDGDDDDILSPAEKAAYMRLVR